jgi:glycosyltransferase involved in cell wall biosynthesis
MKIVHISYSDNGGAGIAALRLHNALLLNGINSKFICLIKTTNNREVYQFCPKPISRIRRSAILWGFLKTIDHKNQIRLSQISNDYEMFSFPTTKFNLFDNIFVRDADIIHLHWVSNFLNWKSFFKHCKKQIVWTLHDFNPFSGGFHYPADKSKASVELNYLDCSLEDLKYNSIINFKKIEIVCLSNWLMNYSKSSRILGKYPHSIIRNSVPISIFRSYSKNSIRKLLGISLSQKVVLFVSETLQNKRKGFDLLLPIINDKEFSDYLFIAVGYVSEKLQELNNKNLKLLGLINDEIMLAWIYNCSDVYVTPSIEDNLPNSVIEALCCGVPVAGFNVAGIKEMIQNGVNGFLAERLTSTSLSDTINKCMVTTFIDIEKNAQKLYSSELQASKYSDLYIKCC